MDPRLLRLYSDELTHLHEVGAEFAREFPKIASRLGITEHTIKFHVNAILGKLEAETRTEAVVHAARLGIVTL